MKHHKLLLFRGIGATLTVNITVDKDRVTIHDNIAITSHTEQKNICQRIKVFDDLPLCIQKRNWRSLRRKWRAHNLLYRLPFLSTETKERLRHVDFDDEPLWRRAVYFILAIF